jgi:acetyl esterase/lipase
MVKTLAALAAAVAAVTAASPGPKQNADPMLPINAQLAASRSKLVDNFRAIDTRSGLAVALEARLDGDVPGIGLSEKPDWMRTSDYIDYMTYLARLEASLIDQYASGVYHPLASVRGADDTVFKSPADGTMQPLAVYVPKSYDPQKAASLVVFLHGRTWSENDLIAQPWVRAAADSTNSIIIAPYARGDSQYVDPASVEVYAALDLAKKTFNIDPRRIYLAGHSMGGYGVFIVGPKHPENWAAVLAASGGMTTETSAAALKGLQGVPVYLVVGSNDPIVPKGYMKQNVDLLTRSGIETHFYEEPGGLHSIGTISNAFDRAWHDMLARTLRTRTSIDRPVMPASPSMTPNTRP